MRGKKVDVAIRYPDIVGDVRVDLFFVFSRINMDAGPDGCWTWIGGKHRQGYGMCSGIKLATGKRVMMTVHRLLLKHKLGYDPGPGVDAVHTCGNMNCVNPAHLITGDAKMIADMVFDRHGRVGGKPPGKVLYKPRNENYKWGVDNIRKLIRDIISPEDFAAINGISVKTAARIKREILAGDTFAWALRELNNEIRGK